LYYPNAAQALAFLIDAFGFTEVEAVRDDEGNVWTAQVSSGDGVVLIGPEMAEFGSRSVDDPAWLHRAPSSTSMTSTSTASALAIRAQRS
jgi:uncharacterized glyoxalase superfamily protein PhnB